MNTDYWAGRLLEAIEADDRGEDPAIPSSAVPNWVLVAAMVGNPSDADAEAILGDPAAVRSLHDHWSRNPPSAELLASAGTNLALRRLLVGTGHPADDSVAAPMRPCPRIAGGTGSPPPPSSPHVRSTSRVAI